MFTAFADVTGLVFEVEKARFVVGCYETNIPTLSTIAAIGAAVWDILFSTEAYATIPTGSRLNINFYFINKGHKYLKTRDEACCRSRRGEYQKNY
jgi:hypothetical protein